MARPKSDRPGYNLHKQSGRAYVAIDGRQHLLPHRYGSTESRAEYERVVGRWLAASRQFPPEPPAAAAGPTVSMVCLAFYRYALVQYVDPSGKQTGEAESFRCVIKPLRKLYGPRPAAAFLPTDLKAFRRAMLEPRRVPAPRNPSEVVERPGWSCGYADHRARRVAEVFKWAGSEYIIRRSVADTLALVSDVRKGGQGAPETVPMHAVPSDVVEATLPHPPPPAAHRYRRTTGGAVRPTRRCRGRTRPHAGSRWRFATSQPNAPRGSRTVRRPSRRPPASEPTGEATPAP